MSQSSGSSGSSGRGSSGATGGRTTGLRFAGVDINLDAHVWVGLTSIYGVGKPRALKICQKLGINPDKKCRFLDSDEETAIREQLSGFLLEGDLRREVAGNKMRLQKIRAYRGLRHFLGLPCRGQNTRNNAKTAGRVK